MGYILNMKGRGDCQACHDPHFWNPLPSAISLGTPHSTHRHTHGHTITGCPLPLVGWLTWWSHNTALNRSTQSPSSSWYDRHPIRFSTVTLMRFFNQPHFTNFQPLFSTYFRPNITNLFCLRAYNHFRSLISTSLGKAWNSARKHKHTTYRGT